jgi:hypothetical protein
MVDYTVANVDDTPIFTNNSSETREVMCACCDKFKVELQKTLIELKLVQKIIELLQEEINMPNRTASTDPCNLHHNENSTQLELKKEN